MSSDGIERAAHAPHRADEIGQTFEREVLAVQRNQHRVGGDERVEREQAERRRAVDEDVIEARRAADRATRCSRCSRSGSGDHLDLGAGEVAIGRNQRQVLDLRRQHERLGRAIGQQRLVDGAAVGALAFQADAARQIALRIDVDEQDPLSGQRDRGREVDGGGGLADAALLVGDGDDAAACPLSDWPDSVI